MALAPNDSVVTIFNATNNGNTVMGVTKIENTGRVDTNFGKMGFTTAGFLGAASSSSTGVAVRDGKIVIMGTYSTTSPTNNGYGILQLLGSGDLDLSFGGSGQTTSLNALTPSDLLLLSDGRAISTLADTSGSSSFTAFTAKGDIDMTFGATNKVSVAGSISLDDQDRVLVATASTAGELESILRFTADGMLDTSFGTNGKATALLPENLAGLAASSTAARVQGDGRIVVLSETTTGVAVISRLWN